MPDVRDEFKQEQIADIIMRRKDAENDAERRAVDDVINFIKMYGYMNIQMHTVNFGV